MVRLTTYHLRILIVQRKQQKENTNIFTNKPHNKQKQKQKQKFTTIGQWNVRTLYQKGKLAQVNKEIGRYKIEVLGLSEVRWTGVGQMSSPSGSLLLYSGHESEHSRGVGILLSKSIREALIEWARH